MHNRPSRIPAAKGRRRRERTGGWLRLWATGLIASALSKTLSLIRLRRPPFLEAAVALLRRILVFFLAFLSLVGGQTMDTAGVDSAKQTADMIKKITLDSQNKASNVSDDVKKPSVRKFGPLHKGNVTNGHVQKYERSTKVQPGYMGESMYYANTYPYYYGAYDGTAQNWNEYSRYFRTEGAEGLFGDNGPLAYNPYVYTPYCTSTSPGPYMDAQQYQQTASHPCMTTSSAPFTPVSTIVEHNDVMLVKDQIQKPATAKPVECNDVKNGVVRAKSLCSDSAVSKKGSLQNGGPLGAAFPASGCPEANFSCGNNAYKNQHSRPHKQLMNKPIGNVAANGFMNRMLGHPIHSGFGYISSVYDSRLYGQGWVSVGSNCMARGQGNGFYRQGNEYADGLNEMNRGPRSKLRSFSRPACVASVVKDISGPRTEVTSEEMKVKLSESAIADCINLPDFPVDYADAKFFIIKSYSEDDVHKSVKYNVWASTPNGNKKLDAAYKQAQEKSAPCPVFLFFSVNASGQFVGVAEMVGSVDFDKNLEYWQQDKWNGCFSLTWHIVKDVPNSLLKHIIIQSNEHKPVTNSRDTQEVNLEQGLQMLKVFKEHSSRISILDDFEFYESRQNAIQEKKVRIQFQKQVWEGKTGNLKSQNGKHSPLEAVSKLTSVTEKNVSVNGN